MYKKFILIFGILTLLVSSCKNTSNSNINESEDIVSETSIGDQISNVSYLKEATAKLSELEKKLLKETPIDNLVLRQFFVDKIDNFNRQELTLGDALNIGIVTGKAVYFDKDDREIEISVSDGTGESGFAFLTLAYYNLQMDVTKETETLKERNIERNGNRYSVSDRDEEDYKSSKITFIISDRFIVNFIGEDLSSDELFKIIDGYDFSILK